MKDDKLLLEIAKKFYPENFKTEFIEKANNEFFKYEEQLHIEIIHRPPVKHCFANYAVRTHFRDKFYGTFEARRRMTKIWSPLPYDEKKFIDTGILRVVRRDCPPVPVDALYFGMINYFKANILLLKDYKMFGVDRKDVKFSMEAHGVFLLFEDELMTG
jgi:hypothetical protein